MKYTEDPVVLYILMRNDLNSLNPGKACAQAAHAANQFVGKFTSRFNRTYANERSDVEIEFRDLYNEWRTQTPDWYGTTIVLEGSGANIENYIDQQTPGLYNGLVIDPTYPIRDGEVTHHIPLMTCAYVFGRKSEIRLSSEFGLMK